MQTVVLGVLMFTIVVLAMVTIILFARARLVATGTVKIEVNGERIV